MILNYEIRAPRGIRIEWCCGVRDVHPNKGNGWDIIGRIAPVKGQTEEGSLLCTKWKSAGAWDWVYMAWQVVRGYPENVQCLATSDMAISPTTLAAMCDEFPALMAIYHKPGMVAVEYQLLKALRQRSEHQREVESTLTAMARMNNRMNEMRQREQEYMERHYPMWEFDPASGMVRTIPTSAAIRITASGTVPTKNKPDPKQSIRDYEPGKRKMRP